MTSTELKEKITTDLSGLAQSVAMKLATPAYIRDILTQIIDVLVDEFTDLSITSTATNYSPTINDRVIVATVSGISISLLSTSTVDKKVYTIKNISDGDITIIPSGSDTIDGNSNFVLESYQSITIVSDGVSKWLII